MIVIDGIARETHKRFVPKQENFDLLGSSFDNSGNVIHAEAPFKFWDNGDGSVVDARNLRRLSHFDFDRTIQFANENASHYVLSAANFVLFENETDERKSAYVSLREGLEKLKVPLVVLGMGVQAPRRWNPTDHRLPQEAIDFMRFLGEKCSSISVRGEFTASIFRDYVGVKNTTVTGCPSFFQAPEAFSKLRSFLSGSRRGNVSFNVTNYRKPAEQDMMRRAIELDQDWVGVQRDKLYEFSIESEVNPEIASIPNELKFALENGSNQIKRDRLVGYFARKYRKFDDAEAWISFHSERTRFSYGTRFHGNMATLLAGRPALWIVHDSRTRELVDALDLPHLSFTECVDLDLDELEAQAKYENLFDTLPEKFKTFNSFLESNHLPRISLQF